MPVRKVRMNTRDAPWMTQRLKDLIRKRQQAFLNKGADPVQYKSEIRLTEKESFAEQSFMNHE